MPHCRDGAGADTAGFRSAACCSYELELRTEEGNRSYTVNCHDKDGSTFRSYTMQTVEGEEEPLNFTYTDYTYDENGNCTDAITTDKTNNSTWNTAAAMTTKPRSAHGKLRGRRTFGLLRDGLHRG